MGELDENTIPAGTYRLQLTSAFTFADAATLADYLADLGVSHVYCSPCLQAGRGSTSGYDVVDHRRANPELGGEEGWRAMVDAFRARGLGIVLDIVPNHMAVTGQENTFWWDVLANGPGSPYAHFFDIDWQPPERKLWGKILMPILGDLYGTVLEQGQLRLIREGNHLVLAYFDHRLPLAADTLGEVLSEASRQGGEMPQALDAAIETINNDRLRLHALLERQHYRLAYWRSAGREINYRRFFEINTLVGLRVERADVFESIHEHVLGWLRQGDVQGLRVDHIDGLRDPLVYLRRLRDAIGNAYLLVEKILEPGEPLRSDWPVQGTTGYDFLNVLGGLFVDRSAESAMTRVYRQFTGVSESYEDIVYRSKLKMLRMSFNGELNRLTELLMDISQENIHWRDFSRHECHEILREAAACLGVYRTYVRPSVGEITGRDTHDVEHALKQAARRRPDLDARLWTMLRDLLLLRWPRVPARGADGAPAASGLLPVAPALASAVEDFVCRFQQLTGPAMAKGLEDTTFYIYNRLISLNEVGGEPGRFGLSLEDFHAYCQAIQQHWPATMNTTSTHDTKRGEDVRVRISLLSEIPELWGQAITRWSDMNERHRKRGMPDRNMEYFIYQTLVGAWPIEVDRVHAAVLKAAREAKEHTAWTAPDAAYEEALVEFVRSICVDEAFVRDLEGFIEPLVPAAGVTIFAQTLLRMTAPGVPDIYQGQELFDNSLVDPDNRRPVDYARRRELLKSIKTGGVDAVRASCHEGTPKMAAIVAALAVRRERPGSFGPSGEYRPLAATGSKAQHVVAFLRGQDVTVVAPRLAYTLRDQWNDTRLDLPRGEWINVLMGDRRRWQGSVLLAELLREVPAALLVRQQGDL